MTYDIVNVNINDVKAGDTILHNDKITTVCNNNIKSGFMGMTLFGDSYILGTLPVKKLINIKF